MPSEPRWRTTGGPSSCTSARSAPAGLEQLLTALRPAAVLPLGELSTAEYEVLERHTTPRATATDSQNQLGHEMIGSLQAEHLVRRGHRRLGYAHLADPRGYVYGPPRLRGFEDACRRLGVDAPQVLHVPMELEAARTALEHTGPPGLAVACYNDDVALTLISAARRLSCGFPRTSP